MYLVHAGTEHQSFVNHFPFWIVNAKVQELNCKVRSVMSKTALCAVSSVVIFAGQEAHPAEGGG